MRDDSMRQQDDLGESVSRQELPEAPEDAAQQAMRGAETAGAADAAGHGRKTFGRSKRRQDIRSSKKTSKAKKASQEHKPSPVVRFLQSWWDRVLTAVFNRNFSDQSEQYAAHMTTRDYIWNSAGLAAWGAQFPLLTIVATQLVGAERAGILSMAYVVGLMLWYLGNYGVRTFQVSDIDEEESFSSYQLQRLITVALMAVVGFIWCALHGYSGEIRSVMIWIIAYRMVDALADVYEGRLQQSDKLYLAGISQAVRCAVSFVGFTVVLFISRSLTAASIAMFVLAIASLLIVTIPLAFFETDGSRPLAFDEVKDLFVQCFPTAAALFLYAVIDSMPKFAMEGMLSYDNQLYYNALYFPAHAIILTVGFIYKPLLVRLAGIWADESQRKRFDLLILAIVGITVAVTVIVGLLMGWIGIPIMSFLYGIDFEKYRELSYVMVASGGCAALIDFLYQVITVLRKQAMVTRIYAIGFAASIPICWLLVGFTGLQGAVLSALFLMGLLCVMLVSAYLGLRFGSEE